MPDRVTMYSRRRCGLCDQARSAIEEVRGSIGFGFEEILIDGDDSLEARYGLRVPVVLVDGEERFEVEVDPGELRRVLGA
jgi:glutaredoxin